MTEEEPMVEISYQNDVSDMVLVKDNNVRDLPAPELPF